MPEKVFCFSLQIAHFKGEWCEVLVVSCACWDHNEPWGNTCRMAYEWRETQNRESYTYNPQSTKFQFDFQFCQCPTQTLSVNGIINCAICVLCAHYWCFETTVIVFKHYEFSGSTCLCFIKWPTSPACTHWLSFDQLDKDWKKDHSGSRVNTMLPHFFLNLLPHFSFLSIIVILQNQRPMFVSNFTDFEYGELEPKGSLI